jgi:anti-anti-sigma factor
VKPTVFDLPRPRCPLPDSGPAPIASGDPEPPAPRYQDLTITVERYGWSLVVAVDGEVDLNTAPLLRHALGTALSQGPRRIVVDLSRVRFLNTAGLAVLLDAHRRAGPGIDLMLVATTRATWRPLRLTGLHERLAVHASKLAAVAAPRRPVTGAR